ncbi:MAG: nucleotide exchange factor GrpE [Gammaproteobacteria bacterium]
MSDQDKRDELAEDEDQSATGASDAQPDDGATTEGVGDSPETSESGASIEEQLAAAEAKASEHWDAFVRAQAEMENLRRRAQRDVENAHKYAVEKFTKELLAVKDSLEMGLNAASEGEDPDMGKLIEGTELTLKMLAQAFEKHGVTEVYPLGEKFDPELHEAMAMQPSAEHEPNTVITVIQKGYTLNDRLVRPAMVMVSKEA